jgi:hypothetical protein
MRAIIGSFLLYIIVLGLIYYVLFKIVAREIAVETNKRSALVGERVVVDKDTLMIVDYSNIFQNYKLSNGKEISFELAEKLKISK